MAATGTTRSTRGMHGRLSRTLTSAGNRPHADPWDSPRGLCVGELPVIARAVGSDQDPGAVSVESTLHSGVAQNGRAPENGLRGPRKGHQGICYPGGVGPRDVEWRTGCGCTGTCPKRDLAEIATSGKRVVLKSPLPSVMRVRSPSPLPSLPQPERRSPRSSRGIAVTGDHRCVRYVHNGVGLVPAPCNHFPSSNGRARDFGSRDPGSSPGGKTTVVPTMHRRAGWTARLKVS